MKANIKLQLLQQKEKDLVTSIFKGRLLGAVQPIDVTKIINNWEVSSRIYTTDTKKLIDVIETLEDMNKNKRITEKYSHIVMSISSMRKAVDGIDVNLISKKLLITPPISLITSIEKTYIEDFIKVTMDCTEDSMLIMEEIEDD